MPSAPGSLVPGSRCGAITEVLRPARMEMAVTRRSRGLEPLGFRRDQITLCLRPTPVARRGRGVARVHSHHATTSRVASDPTGFEPVTSRLRVDKPHASARRAGELVARRGALSTELRVLLRRAARSAAGAATAEGGGQWESRFLLPDTMPRRPAMDRGTTCTACTSRTASFPGPSLVKQRSTRGASDSSSWRRRDAERPTRRAAQVGRVEPLPTPESTIALYGARPPLTEPAPNANCGDPR
jgi:hypothetical protein